ncbi:hypothetical protein HDU84_002093 [Entophlyctis sp. JEL0112]|nr:hypothetical protein HDU84_002093 [Entophlyctis sp. JEL0112]
MSMLQLQTALHPLVAHLLALPPQQPQTPDMVAARNAAARNIAELREMYRVAQPVSTSLLIEASNFPSVCVTPAFLLTRFGQWCLDLLSQIPAPVTSFRSYQELIKHRLSDSLVFPVVDLLVFAIHLPQQPARKQEMALLLIKAAYPIPALRWVLYCVTERCADICFPLLHKYVAERLLEMGNPVFEDSKRATQSEQTESWNIQITICQSLAMRLSKGPGIDMRDSEFTLTCLNSLLDIFLKSYFDGVVKAGQMTEVGGIDPYCLVLAPYFLTVVYVYPHILSFVAPTILQQIKSNGMLSKIVFYECKLSFSQLRLPPSQSNLQLSPIPLCNVIIKFLVDFLSIGGKANADATDALGSNVPEKVIATFLEIHLCDLFLLVESLFEDAFNRLSAADSTSLDASVWTIISNSCELLLTKIIQLLQDAHLQNESEPTPASGPVSRLFASFTPRILDLCRLVAVRSASYASQTVNQNGRTQNRKFNYIVLLLELLGLAFGKTVAETILVHVIGNCTWPVVAVPLDNVAVGADGLGEWNCVYICGCLRIAWTGRTDLASAYENALNAIIRNFIARELNVAAGDANIFDSFGNAAINIYYLALQPDATALHAIPSNNTSLILASQAAALVTAATAVSKYARPSRRWILLALAKAVEAGCNFGLFDCVVGNGGGLNESLVQPPPPRMALLADKLWDAFFEAGGSASAIEKGEGSSQDDQDERIEARDAMRLIAAVCARLCSGGRDPHTRTLRHVWFREILAAAFVHITNFRGVPTSSPVPQTRAALTPAAPGMPNAVPTGAVSEVKGSSDSTPMQVDSRSERVHTGILRELRDIDSDLAASSVGANGESWLIEKKPLLRRWGGENAKRDEAKRIQDRWNMLFKAPVVHLIDTCVFAQEEADSGSGYLWLGLAIRDELMIRSLDSPPTVLPFEAQSIGDQLILTKFKNHDVFWDLARIVAQGEYASAFSHIEEIVRVHCGDLVRVWLRQGNSVPGAEPEHSLKAEVQRTQSLITLICVARHMSSVARNSVVLVPLIPGKDVAALVQAFWDANTVGKVVSAGPAAAARDEPQQQQQQNSARVEAAVRAIVRRNVVAVGVELACLYL